MVSRWGLLVLIAVLMAAGLYQVRRFETAQAPRDEVLAYEVTSRSSVELAVHAGTAQVSVSTWPLVPWGMAAEATIVYGIEVLLSDSEGTPVEYRRYDARSRVTLDPNSLEPSASLADGTALVGGSRAIEIDVSKIQRTGGKMTITAARGAHERVLLLATYKLRRTALEQSVLERSVSASERRRVVGQRSSLGFFDLPTDVRMESLAYKTRRLTALGREGAGYQSRRLLLGEREAAPTEQGWKAKTQPIGATKHIALNVNGPLELSVVGPPGFALTTQESWDARAVRSVIPEHGQLDLSFQETGLRTIVLSGETDAEIALSVEEGEVSALVGDVERWPVAGRVSVIPDTRSFRVYGLSQDSPVRYRVAPGQPGVGFTARIMPPPIALEPERAYQSSFEVRWLDSEERSLLRGIVQFASELSSFENIEGKAVTEPTKGRLRAPTGAASFELLGPSNVLLSVNTDNPGVDQSEISLPYELELPEELSFRNAPFAKKTWATLHPDNADLLELSGRVPRLRAQVRLEPRTSGGSSIKERVLVPSAAAQSRYLFTPTTYSSKYSFPSDAWTPLSSKEKRLMVPEGGRVEVAISAEVSRLGENWTLLRSGQEQYSARLVSTATQLTLETPPGPQALSATGVGKTGSVLVRAPPETRGRILRRRRVYALKKGGRLKFDFVRGPNERLGAIVQVASLDSNREVRLRYRFISRGSSDAGASAWLRHRRAPSAGDVRLRTGTRGKALLWSARTRTAREQLPERLGAVTLPVGDGVGTGPATLELSQASGAEETVWIRVLIVGRRLDQAQLSWSALDDAGTVSTKGGR